MKKKIIFLLVIVATLFLFKSMLAAENYGALINKDVLGLKLGMEKFTALRYVQSLDYKFEDYFKNYDDFATFKKYFNPEEPSPNTESERLQVSFSYPSSGCTCNKDGVVLCSQYHDAFRKGSYSGDYTASTLSSYLNQRSDSYVDEINYTYTFPHKITADVANQIKQKFIVKYGKNQQETSYVRDKTDFKYTIVFSDIPFNTPGKSLDSQFWGDHYNVKIPVILVEIRNFQYKIVAKWRYPKYVVRTGLCNAAQQKQKKLENSMDFKVKY